MVKKICSKCNEEKDICNFYTDKSKIDGLYSSCKECKNTYSKTRMNEIKIYLKIWRSNNPDYFNQFRKSNPDYVRKYYQDNKNILLTRSKKTLS